MNDYCVGPYNCPYYLECVDPEGICLLEEEAKQIMEEKQ